MTAHRLPAQPSPEELLVGWICETCGRWVVVADPQPADCPGPMVAVEPPPCIVCAKTNAPILLPRDRVDAWHAGELIQRAFPEMSPAQREVLITGTHPACFDATFADEESA